MVYDNNSNAGLSQMIESVQYNATLSITGAIRGSSRQNYIKDLDLKVCMMNGGTGNSAFVIKRRIIIVQTSYPNFFLLYEIIYALIYVCSVMLRVNYCTFYIPEKMFWSRETSLGKLVSVFTESLHDLHQGIMSFRYVR